jgi:hypothetical protein
MGEGYGTGVKNTLRNLYKNYIFLYYKFYKKYIKYSLYSYYNYNYYLFYSLI